MNDLATWLTIESAPRTGARIRVAREDADFGIIEGTAIWEPEFGGGWLARGDGRAVADGLGLAHPTHWLPDDADMTIDFGRHRGQQLDTLPDHYLAWLADPARETPAPDKAHKPLPPVLVAYARGRHARAELEKAREAFALRCLGGHPHHYDQPIYVIECDGDCYSRSGQYAIDNQWFPSLDEALAYLASEFPLEPDENNPGQMVRQTPDPEDDSILVWEVLPSGHRKTVWGFYGWHWPSAEEHSVHSNCALPGDEESLYTIACRDL